jgi:hypothetical protein
VDKDGLDLMRDLTRAASSTGQVKYGSFLASVHWEVSVFRSEVIMPSFVRGYSSTLVLVGMLVLFLGC